MDKSCFCEDQFQGEEKRPALSIRACRLLVVSAYPNTRDGQEDGSDDKGAAGGGGLSSGKGRKFWSSGRGRGRKIVPSLSGLAERVDG